MSRHGRVQQSLKEIGEIVSAIEAGDAACREASIDHVHKAAGVAFEALRQR
jgi:hypothetical protein